LAIAAAYQQLGLSVTASEQDVRRAYKNLAIQLHPDKLVKASDADRAAAEDKFKAVAAAYSMLVN
jgi:curved DNA-binding protein CbpA